MGLRVSAAEEALGLRGHVPAFTLADMSAGVKAPRMDAAAYEVAPRKGGAD